LDWKSLVGILIDFPYLLSNTISMNLAYTGLVMNIPMRTPRTVVNANPESTPIPVAPRLNPI